MVSPIHHASLVDPATHSPALLDLIHIKLSSPVIEYVVNCVADTVDYAMGRPSSSYSSSARRSQLTTFTKFVNNVITRAEISTPVVLASLAYMDRAKPHLHIALEEWALERVFLGAIMTASKYLNDSTLKNVHWALCTGVFGKRDVGRIEREFLDVLDFELRITEDDILSHHNHLSAITHSVRPPQFSTPHSHAHHHRRHSQHHHIGVPELEPSSPQSSSLGSSSPRTPLSPLASPPSFVPTRKSSFPHASETLPPAPKHKKSLHVSTLDLLRSFPIPIPLSHRKANTHEPSHSSACRQGMPRPQLCA